MFIPERSGTILSVVVNRISCHSVLFMFLECMQCAFCGSIVEYLMKLDYLESNIPESDTIQSCEDRFIAQIQTSHT